MYDENVLRKFALPESAVNFAGLRYDPRDDVWPVSTGSNLHLSRYREVCTPLFLQSLKLTLVTLNRIHQPSSIRTYLTSGLNPLLERMGMPVGEIGQADLEAHWFALPPERKWWFKSLKILCPSVALHGIPSHSITSEALDWLEAIHPGSNDMGWRGRG